MYFANYYLISFRQILVVMIVLTTTSVISCNFTAISKSNYINASNNTEILQSKCKYTETKERPSGTELQINIERISDNNFLIKVKNQSNHKVFLSYTPKEDNLASFVSFTTERRNQKGEFVTYFDGGDVASLIRDLDSNQEIGFQFFEIEKGDYMLKFRYLIDEELVAVLNDPECRFKFSDSNRRLIAEAYYQIITPILKINKNIPMQK